MADRDIVFRIRAYAPGDLDALIGLFRRSVRALGGGPYTEEQVRAWAPDEIDRDAWGASRTAQHTWVASEGDRILGFTGLSPDGHIDMLFVDPDCQRRGVGRTLLDRVEEEAHRSGLPRLTVEASLAARSLFERRGFVVTLDQTVERHGQRLRRFRMEKQLAAESVA